jgi:hypothetical protein
VAVLQEAAFYEFAGLKFALCWCMNCDATELLLQQHPQVRHSLMWQLTWAWCATIT